MAGKSHFRVRGVTCGKCERIHTWYKYRVWREGNKVKEEYIGKCDRYGNRHAGQRNRSHQTHQEQARQHTSAHTRPHRSPYEVLGVTYYATQADINRAYRYLVKQYHPDLHKHIDPRIIVEINVAYQTLTK